MLSEEQAIDILQNQIADYVIGDYCAKCADFSICSNKDKDCYYIQAIDTVLNLIAKLEKENEELKSNNLEKARILEMFDDRKYRKKYLEERRKEEPNLLYPDADEIYRRYYEQKKQIDLMAEEIRKTILIVKPESKFCQYENDCKNIRCKDCIKQYFEKLAKEENNNE